jgi:23S rRNA pseudouridine1911/1915/1917 synthase
MRQRKFRASETEKSSPLGPWLSGKLGISRAEADQLIFGGAVYLNGRRCRDGNVEYRGAMVTVVLEEGGDSALAASAEEASIEILHEDPAILVVNKRAGIPTQATQSSARKNLFDAVIARYSVPKSGMVHRLDRDTSGAIVFARTKAAARDLAEQFRNGKVEKRYWAIVAGTIADEGVIDLPISKDPSHLGRRRATKQAHGQPAITKYRVLHRGAVFTVLELTPSTGRSHQIRAHLSAVGTPIVGDKLYGGSMAAGYAVQRCLLHARSLSFRHPVTGRAFQIEAPAPADMKAFLQGATVGVQ